MTTLLADIYTKVCNIEEKIRRMEIREALGSYAHTLTILEERAKTCPDFNCR